MKAKRQLRTEQLLFSIGLLLIILPNVFKEYIPMPDFFHGLLVGTGIGLEIIGLILMKKKGLNRCKDSRPETEV